MAGTDQELIDIDNDATLNAIEKVRKRQEIINARALSAYDAADDADEV